MIAATFWSLLTPALEAATAQVRACACMRCACVRCPCVCARAANPGGRAFPCAQGYSVLAGALAVTAVREALATALHALNVACPDCAPRALPCACVRVCVCVRVCATAACMTGLPCCRTLRALLRVPGSCTSQTPFYQVCQCSLLVTLLPAACAPVAALARTQALNPRCVFCPPGTASLVTTPRLTEVRACS
jgi:hypothetical protein